MKRKKIIAIVTSMVMLFGITAWANADQTEPSEVTETVVEETTEEAFEYAIPTDEYVEITIEEDETEDEAEESLEVDDSTEESDVLDEVEESTDEEDELEEDDAEDDEEDIEYDVEGFELYGWWVPSVNYNPDDTVSFFLEDDTCFLTTPTAGVQCGDVIWQSSGLWSYVEMTYGGEDNLTGEAASSYWAVQDSLI